MVDLARQHAEKEGRIRSHWGSRWFPQVHVRRLESGTLWATDGQRRAWGTGGGDHRCRTPGAAERSAARMAGARSLATGTSKLEPSALPRRRLVSPSARESSRTRARLMSQFLWTRRSVRPKDTAMADNVRSRSKRPRLEWTNVHRSAASQAHTSSRSRKTIAF